MPIPGPTSPADASHFVLFVRPSSVTAVSSRANVDFFRTTGKVAVPLTVREVLDEHIVGKLA